MVFTRVNKKSNDASSMGVITHNYNDDGTMTKREIQTAGNRQLIEVDQISCCVVNSTIISFNFLITWVLQIMKS